MSSWQVQHGQSLYRVVVEVKREPERDPMAEVAQLIGEQPSPEIMQEQGYDWTSQN